MLDHKPLPPLPLQDFIRKMSRQLLIALAATLIALAVGMIGYHLTEGLSWIDSFLNASMILSGMGEVDALKTTGGKLFAGVYALFSGLWLITCMSLLLAPVLHRVLRHFHAEQDHSRPSEKNAVPPKPKP